MFWDEHLPTIDFDVWEVSWTDPPKYIRLLGTIRDRFADSALLNSHIQFEPTVGRLLIVKHIYD